MNDHLQKAYALGTAHARAVFEKDAQDWGEGTPWSDVGTAAAGAVPLAGPALAGLVSGQTTPIDKSDVAALTSQQSLGHSLLGGLGGAAGGAGLGALAGLLAQKYDLGDLDPRTGATYGAMLGGGLGTMAGGAYGAHRGRNVGQDEARQEVRTDLSELESALGAVEEARQQGYAQALQALGGFNPYTR